MFYFQILTELDCTFLPSWLLHFVECCRDIFHLEQLQSSVFSLVLWGGGAWGVLWCEIGGAYGRGLETAKPWKRLLACKQNGCCNRSQSLLKRLIIPPPEGGDASGALQYKALRHSQPSGTGQRVHCQIWVLWVPDVFQYECVNQNLPLVFCFILVLFLLWGLLAEDVFVR